MNEWHEKRRKLRKHRLRNIVLNLICILLAGSGLWFTFNYFRRHINYEITNDAFVDQYVAPINIRVSGYIQEVRFREHQYVHKGDTLLVLDNREYIIKVKEAEAALLDAHGTQDVIHSGVETSHTNVAVQEANIAEAKAKLWQLEQDYHRCEASLDIARLNLSYTVLTAPYDGYIGRRTLEPGQYVQSGQTISYLVRSKDKWVTANYKETQIAHIFIGQEVIIKVDALPGRRFRGRVTAISEATGSKYSLVPTDNSAGNFVKVQQRIPVRIEFEGVTDEEMALLRAGMMVETEALRR